jgi:hypothetical protein
MIDAINGVKITGDELLQVVKAAHETHEAQEGGEDLDMIGLFGAMKVFPGNQEKIKAIMLRLQAMSEILRQDELSTLVFASDSEEEAHLANQAIFTAAAELPLEMIDGKVQFAKESFRGRILELLKPKGSA